MKYRSWIANRLLKFFEEAALGRRVPDWVFQREREAGICVCHSMKWGLDYDCNNFDREWDFG